MKKSFKWARRINRRIRRGLRGPIRRRGNLLGMIGLAALGVTLLEKHQREQQRTQTEGLYDENNVDHN